MREFTARGIRLSEPELFVPFSYPVWPHPENRKPRMCHCAQSGFNANDPGSIGNHHSSSRTTKVARHSSRPAAVPLNQDWEGIRKKLAQAITTTK